MRQNLGLFVAILPWGLPYLVAHLTALSGSVATNVLWLATWLAPTGMEA